MATVQTYAVLLFVNFMVRSHTAAVFDSYVTGFVGLSIHDCYDECTKHVSCKSVVYNRRATYCRLYAAVIPEYHGKKIKGLEYADVETRPEMAYSGFCNGEECISGQTCETDCTFTECKSPSISPNVTTFGNLRTIGSKMIYVCTKTRDLRSSVCLTTGKWSLDDFFCRWSGFIFYSTDVFFFNSGTYLLYTENVTLSNVTRDQCLTACRDNTESCITVNYSPTTRYCVLVDIQVGATAVYSNQMVQVQGWEVYHKVLPISFQYNPGSGYTYTFAEAVEYCQSIGTTIAQESDIDLAYSLGYNMCRCGWVEEGYAMISLHYIATGCSTRVGVNKCWVAEVFDVFCKNPDY